MNLNMIQRETKTDDSLLSITKNCEKLNKQNHRKAEVILEFKMIKLRETFHFNPPVEVEVDWMIGLTDLEVYNSIFSITGENNKFEFYTDPLYSKFSFSVLKDKIAELLDVSHITPEYSELKTTGPDII